MLGPGAAGIWWRLVSRKKEPFCIIVCGGCPSSIGLLSKLKALTMIAKRLFLLREFEPDNMAIGAWQ